MSENQVADRLPWVPLFRQVDGLDRLAVIVLGFHCDQIAVSSDKDGIQVQVEGGVVAADLADVRPYVHELQAVSIVCVHRIRIQIETRELAADDPLERSAAGGCRSSRAVQ